MGLQSENCRISRENSLAYYSTAPHISALFNSAVKGAADGVPHHTDIGAV